VREERRAIIRENHIEGAPDPVGLISLGRYALHAHTPDSLRP